MGMANAYSMINQELQNSVSEKEYLEKTNQDFKVKEWGTTNLAIICDDKIFVGVDSRATSGMDKGFIISETAGKLFRINDYNILGAMAGNAIDCSNTLTYVKRKMENLKEVMEHMRNTKDAMEIDEIEDLLGIHFAVDEIEDLGIHFAAREAKKYIDIQSNSFDGSPLIIGWEQKDERFDPHIYKVSKEDFIIESTRHELVVNGSGGERAALYWRQHYKPGNNSREEILNLMKRTLSYVSLFDEMSGGIMRVVEMKPLGYNEEYNQQVLQVLFDHYDHLGNDLSSSLFTLWNNTDGAYVHELNIKVHESFIEEFEGYKQSVVIRKNKKFIIRLLHFEEDCHVDLALKKVENNHKFWVQLNRQPEHLVDIINT
ncbi:PREDICTED: proteasome subunit beta type-5-B-like isoform X1 [Prunus mume]|uniref:Proteasome subunit beta type-5-B-like isoform X1 n=1 Tax=Prunus mume TaxID=102107 RepID=A0ABM0NI70_PRUMU|nr:PREDICTED: proteasome subunit beta type-5-B-like isoform X1 [Prunus mume]